MCVAPTSVARRKKQESPTRRKQPDGEYEVAKRGGATIGVTTKTADASWNTFWEKRFGGPRW